MQLVVVESQPSESAKGASARRAGVPVDAVGMRQELLFPQPTFHVVAHVEQQATTFALMYPKSLSTLSTPRNFSV